MIRQGLGKLAKQIFGKSWDFGPTGFRLLKSYGLTEGKSQESPKGSDSGKSESELKYLKE